MNLTIARTSGPAAFTCARSDQPTAIMPANTMPIWQHGSVRDLVRIRPAIDNSIVATAKKTVPQRVEFYTGQAAPPRGVPR